MSRTTHTHALAFALVLGAALAACSDDSQGTSGDAAQHSGARFGLPESFRVESIATGLMNPSSVTFDARGRATVCDSGNGRVLVANESGKLDVWIDGFRTEYWKIDLESGRERFLLGPLSAVWLPDGRLAVTDGGQRDGEERIVVCDAGEVDEMSNAIPPTTDLDADLGEGNLCGMSLSPDGKTLWVCGQGSDAKSWVLAFDVASQRLEPKLSADDHAIPTESPMQTLQLGGDRLLVLYSGNGGVDDGLVVEWDIATGMPTTRWTLPGLVDPMGMAALPDGSGYVVVDNNWALTEVLEGRIARVRLPAEGGAAEIEVVASRVPGPVSCAFAPDGRLFVTLLGRQFDARLGEVVAISGF